MALGFMRKHTSCGLCGKRTLITGTHVKDGVICRDCERRLRPAFPKREGYRRLSVIESGYDGTGATDNTELGLIDPLEDETIESLRRHLDPPRWLAEECEASPIEEKASYTVVLTNVRRGQAVPVTKAVVSTCGIPMERAWDIAERLPAILGTDVPRHEALRWKRAIEAEGAVVELR